MSDDIDFPVLECGHLFTNGGGAGKCTTCRRKCCARCLTAINGDLLCPFCFAFLVRG